MWKLCMIVKYVSRGLIIFNIFNAPLLLAGQSDVETLSLKLRTICQAMPIKVYDNYGKFDLENRKRAASIDQYLDRTSPKTISSVSQYAQQIQEKFYYRLPGKFKQLSQVMKTSVATANSIKREHYKLLEVNLAVCSEITMRHIIQELGSHTADLHEDNILSKKTREALVLFSDLKNVSIEWQDPKKAYTVLERQCSNTNTDNTYIGQNTIQKNKQKIWEYFSQAYPLYRQMVLAEQNIKKNFQTNNIINIGDLIQYYEHARALFVSSYIEAALVTYHNNSAIFDNNLYKNPVSLEIKAIIEQIPATWDKSGIKGIDKARNQASLHLQSFDRKPLLYIDDRCTLFSECITTLHQITQKTPDQLRNETVEVLNKELSKFDFTQEDREDEMQLAYDNRMMLDIVRSVSTTIPAGAGILWARGAFGHHSLCGTACMWFLFQIGAQQYKDTLITEIAQQQAKQAHIEALQTQKEELNRLALEKDKTILNLQFEFENDYK